MQRQHRSSAFSWHTAEIYKETTTPSSHGCPVGVRLLGCFGCFLMERKQELKAALECICDHLWSSVSVSCAKVFNLAVQICTATQNVNMAEGCWSAVRLPRCNLKKRCLVNVNSICSMRCACSAWVYSPPMSGICVVFSWSESCRMDHVM